MPVQDHSSQSNSQEQPLLQRNKSRDSFVWDKYFCLLIFCFFCGPTFYASKAMARDELEEWLELDEKTSIEDVSEGELRFLTEAPAKPVLHSLNKLTVFVSSLDDGWVAMSQCYQNLDPVAEAEVIYDYKSMRDLKIVKHKNIGATQIIGHSIQLTNVQKKAELCVMAMVRILYQNADGSYSLINGPFHRKFLDGYYPYHLTLEVIYPVSSLKLKHTLPAEQPGFNVKKQDGKLLLDCLFEGILNVEIVFLHQESRQ